MQDLVIRLWPQAVLSLSQPSGSRNALPLIPVLEQDLYSCISPRELKGSKKDWAVITKILLQLLQWLVLFQQWLHFWQIHVKLSCKSSQLVKITPSEVGFACVLSDLRVWREPDPVAPSETHQAWMFQIAGTFTGASYVSCCKNPFNFFFFSRSTYTQ